MKLFCKAKDGGLESKVTGYWLIESKKFFSIVLLKFDEGSREAYHTHAFDAISWVFKGQLMEHSITNNEDKTTFFNPSIMPIITPRSKFHRVFGTSKTTWALSFRGPWIDEWKEYIPASNKDITLTHGRREV